MFERAAPVEDTDANRLRELRVEAARANADWTELEETCRWAWARCDITDPPGWLRKNTACSWGFHSLQRQEMPGGWERLLRVVVREVSILSPGVEPAEPRARVVLIEERKDSPAGGTSDRAAAGEVIDQPALRHRPPPCDFSLRSQG